MSTTYSVSHDSRDTRYARQTPYEVETTGPDLTIVITVGNQRLYAQGSLAGGSSLVIIPPVPRWVEGVREPESSE
jgi:hypothetical protein